MKIKFLKGLLIIASLNACTSKSEKQSEAKPTSQSSVNTSNNSDNNYESSSINYSDQESSEDNSISNEDNSSSCKFEDGTYSATVDYNNSETGYSATYTLDVEVQDCQIVQINFPNDGYLDGDHISYADIDENGNASVDGEDGKSYEIQIDN
jgi:hypothetical protein